MDFAFQGRHPPAQLAAMAAYTQDTPEVEQPWYLDSGANHHVTSELEKLNLKQPYQGNDSVTVGNGGGLQIANTGSSLISTPISLFYLHKVLHCPKASANLLSIQQFCRDNHCYFILTSTHFTIKDMQTRRSFCKGQVKQVCIQSTSSSSNPINSSPKLSSCRLQPFSPILLHS
jgi:hypothetical protein